jgi:hypothetical protein
MGSDWTGAEDSVLMKTVSRYGAPKREDWRTIRRTVGEHRSLSATKQRFYYLKRQTGKRQAARLSALLTMVYVGPK